MALRKFEPEVETTALVVNELFRSIQGESTYQGWPCTFIRLTGCGLRCSYCDTTYAFHEGRRMTLSEVLEAVAAFGLPLVEVTGGEPLEQEPVYPLMDRLLERGYQVLLETSGALDAARVPEEVVRILDVKTPGSGESGRIHWPNLEKARITDQFKFVLVDEDDYRWAVEVVERYRLRERAVVLFSPSFDDLEPHVLAQWVLRDRLDARLNLQLHKVIWSPDARGV